MQFVVLLLYDVPS